MPVVKHVAVADMTADSHHFRTEEQLIADGFEPVRYPPCDYHSPEDTDGAAHPGTLSRPLDGSRDWEWFGMAMFHGYDKDTWESICGVCRELLAIATGPHCGYCGEGISRWCRDCRDEYYASLFGDYKPETDDCGCAWHNIYAERQLCEERRTSPDARTRQISPTDVRPDYAARWEATFV